MTEPLLRSNLTDALARWIGLQLIGGSLRPGDLLPTETELALQQGVSRSVVRESIKALASKGMLSSRPGRGATIQAADNWNMLDPDVISWAMLSPGRGSYLLDLVALRLIVEPAAAAMAAQNQDDEARAKIVEAAARMRGDHDDPARFPDADFEFHRALFAAAGNPFLVPVFNAFSVALLKSLTWYWDPSRNEATVELHERVAEAIMARDAEAAREATVVMLEDARNLWSRQLDRSDPGRPDNNEQANREETQ